MKRRNLIITSIVVVLVIVAGAAFYFSGAYNKIMNPTPVQQQDATVTVKGSVVCLPHKNTDGPTTLECAVGLKSDDGTYYGLSGAANSDLAGAAGSDRQVNVTGTFQEQVNDKYTMKGVITVKDFNFIQ
jgi:hypothetical protein